MEVVNSIDQLEALRDEWNGLADQGGHALLRHEWFLSAARTLHSPRELSVVCMRRSGRLAAVAPLVEMSCCGVRRLRFIGASALHEPGGLLARDTTARSALLDALSRVGQPVALERLSIEDADFAQLQRMRRRGVLMVKQTAPTLRVVLGGEGTRHLSRLGAKLRYDLKRARTRASAQGEMSVELVRPGPPDIDEALETFMRIEASGWKGQGGSALSSRPRLRAFFSTYCRLAAASGILRLFFLRFGGTIAAAQIAAEVYDRLWVLKIGYNASMAHCSPGFLLTDEAIRYAAGRRLASYEFLGGAEAWEHRWRPVNLPTTLLAFYPWSVSGFTGAALDVAGSAWGRLSRIKGPVKPLRTVEMLRGASHLS